MPVTDQGGNPRLQTSLGSLLDRSGDTSGSHTLMKHMSMVPYAHQLSESRMSGRSGDTGKNKKRRKKRNPVTANLAGTRYEVVREMVEKNGFHVSRDDDPNSFLLWFDSFVSTEKISELKVFQRINHFPGMGEITRKDSLARNMAKMCKLHPDEYNFVPKTWILPADYSVLQNYAKDLKAKKKHRTFIVKPSTGAQGHGISLYKNAEKIPQSEHFIVQEYLDKPYLLDGYKFDLRIYVLMTSCDPLRIFLFNDGLVRLSTEKYIPPHDSNIDSLFMHLTNYSLNKHSENYEKDQNEDTGSKRTIRYLNEYLRKEDKDVAWLWKNISDVIIKTLIVAEPHILHAYRMCRPGQQAGSDSVCFEILGFDIFLDRKLKPWLLEINRSPSFGTDEALDYRIKSGLLEDTLRLLNVKASDKRKNLAAQKAESQKRLFQQPSRKSDIMDLSDLEKKKLSTERRKEELKGLLSRIRKDATREDFENRNCGRFRRIFPPDDKFHADKFTNLLTSAFSTFLSGKATTLTKEIERTYNNKLKEADILDMLAQCEADEKEGRIMPQSRQRGPAIIGTLCYRTGSLPLMGMPYSVPVEETEGTDTHESEEDEEGEDTDSGTHLQGRSRPVSGALQNGRTGSRPVSGRPTSGHQSRPPTQQKSPGTATRARSLSRPQSASNRLPNGIPVLEESVYSTAARDMEEDLTRKSLSLLNDMKIKFPGKTDEEAEWILDKIQENWKFHKPRIASYWLVKLDSIKRRKVIDIVRSNVRAVLQRTWKCPDVESLRLYRIFNRVFNRLLWSHGQGLWNCFGQSGNSWETIFSKSSDSISSTEMNCCRRIVQLCRDCLLIVYQFASDAKNLAQQSSSLNEETGSTKASPRALSSLEKRTQTWSPNQTVSQRVSRLYPHRMDSTQS
ncbi:tubulin polyglutamylase TTLL7 isoform X2 [Lingula anatina]|uniref:Tubulin polyglutamylase TTLL7 isoform X2 n=1 Tax=Lingula anatina TaxID=7574 RepID=A0A1S3II96_LINAN|nr:tubulin polyglutamylase TTLL7 isoform X2 [Lingula anatina]|eukprot:XP_013397848.1 tubulin polyglutamylase TTLL7 isoform X2 [Lingula anatina]